MRPQPTLHQLQNQVTAFNRAYQVGDKVKVMKDAHGGDTFIDEIKHQATIMGGHTAMAWLKEKGSYDLTFVVGLADD